MTRPIQKRVLRSLFLALRPLAKILITSGIGFREFAEVAKAAFVDVAVLEYGIRGRPTNSSRVAVITGLSRKEAARVRESSITDAVDGIYRESPASVILHHWHNDPNYVDVNGLPKILPYKGSKCSFEALVSKYAGDIPAGALRAELKRLGAIDDFQENFVIAKKPYFVPSGIDDLLVIGFEDVLASALSTLAHNCDLTRSGKPRFQRVASVGFIDPKYFRQIEDYSTQRLTETGLEFCRYLDEFERKSTRPESNDEAENIQVGIGLYYYQRHF